MLALAGLITLVVNTPSAASDTSAPPPVPAVRLQVPVVIDGRLDEQVWSVPGYDQLVQKQPVEGGRPSQRTMFWVAYDDQSLYVAARMNDTAPDSVNLRLSRRDEFFQTDKFTVYIDGYRDKQTGNYFTVTASGVQIDGVLYNDDWDDNSWDGVWESATLIDDAGWTAELRIPFSQLRLHDADRPVLGINVRRDVSRNQERNYIVFTPRNGSGFVSRFVELRGLENISPGSQVEVIPYLTTRARFYRPTPGDPLTDGKDYTPGAGFDMRMRLPGNLTLTGTINPDFGQVEVDPAVVNLSDVETFFTEKRPFFVEGASLFRFGNGGSNDFWGFNFISPNLFYSRRVGRSPRGSLPPADYVDRPLGTHILGAVKVTGKVGDELSVGTLHALTNREHATTMSAGVRGRAEVEPMAYTGVVRLQRTFAERRYGLGIMSTAVARFFDDARLSDEMNRDALVAGLDGWAFLDESRTYVLTVWGALSQVRGSASQITSLQTNSTHYYQRPDADHVSVDSAATALRGYAYRLALNKQQGQMIFNAAFGVVDPGFEINDAGFISRTDMINGHIVTGYKWTTPTDWYRYATVRLATFASYDFQGNKTWHGYFTNSYIELPSYWSAFFGAVYNPPSFSNRLTRGGPVMLRPDGVETFFGFDSDSRKELMVEAGFFQYLGGGGRDRTFDVELQYRPSPGLTLSVGPSYSENRSWLQWVGRYADPAAAATFGTRYLFADLDQKTLATNFRLNWVFAPTLSLQLFTQVLFSSGDYRGFKALSRPGTHEFLRYGEDGSTVTPDDPERTSRYTFDADGAGPAVAAAIGNPDFDHRSIRGNAVLRWEYAPGSTLFFVWTQSRSDFENVGTFQFRRSLSQLALAPAENIFMIKLTYWWNS